MRTFSIAFLLILLTQCDTSKPTSANDRFFYLFYKIDGRIDTVKYEPGYSQSAKQFRFLTEYRFKDKGTEHLISFYANDVGVPVDGGELFYTLDNFGIIFSRATSWPNYGRLQSTNDSIKELIDVAVNNIVLNPNLHCYNCSQNDKSIAVDTLPPVQKIE